MAQEADSPAERFFGIAPAKLTADIYTSGEQLISDGIDSLERTLLEDFRDVLGQAPRRGKGAASSSSSAAAAGPTDTSITSEIAAGCDAVWRLLLEAYAFAGDHFEVYSLMNTFKWPQGLELEGDKGAKKSKAQPRVTAAQEKAIDDRIGALERQIAAERQKRRTLLFLRDLFSKRLPQARAAAEALEAVLTTLKAQGAWQVLVPGQEGGAGSSSSSSSSGSSAGAVLSDLLARAARLRDMCDRLAAAMPAAAVTQGVDAAGAGSGAAAVGDEATEAVLQRLERDRAAMSGGGASTLAVDGLLGKLLSASAQGGTASGGVMAPPR